MAIVYIATNRTNGKRYIGFTSHDIAWRMAGHFKQAREGRKTRFAAAIRKYGPDAFDWCEMCRCGTVEDAKQKEIELIALLQPEYNVTAGGDGTPGAVAHNRRPVICLNTGEVFQSGAAAETAHNLYTGAVSVSCGRQSIVAGLHFTQFNKPMESAQCIAEIARRMSVRVSRRRRSQREPTGKQPCLMKDVIGRSVAGPLSVARLVICLDDGERFESASAAARAYGLPRSAIIELCLGKRGRKTVGGLRFAYGDPL